MKTIARSFVALMLAGAWPGSAAAQTATQTVAYDVAPIVSIGFPDSAPMTIAITGFWDFYGKVIFHQVIRTYNFTSNQPVTKIVGSLDVAMPLNTYVRASVAPPGTGTTIGGMWNAPILDATPADLVTGIGPTSVQGLSLTVQFAVPSPMAPASWSRVITFTVLAQ